MTKRVPEIRFEGFTDDWEQRKLYEISEIITGSTPKTTDKANYDGDYLFVSPADIQENRYVSDTITKLSKKGFETGRKITKNSILFVSIGSTIGKIGQATKELVTNQQINSVVTNNENDSDFLYASLVKDSEKIKKLAATQAVPIINKTSFSNTILFVPKIEEQQRIGAVFKILDDTINLHQRKLEQLQSMKDGFLQKMFPIDGEKEPEIRFPGFTDDWEQRKLDEIVEFFSGLTYSPDNVVEQPGTLVLRSSNVQNGEIVNADNVYVKDEVVNSDNVQVGDIVVVVRNGSKRLIGKHAAIKSPMKDTVIGAFMTGVRSGTPTFTNALLDSKQFEIEIEKNLGATINQITTGNFKKMTFNFPKVDERLKIGGFFNQLDNTITLHQRELELLKQTKKAFLQKMFV